MRLLKLLMKLFVASFSHLVFCRYISTFFLSMVIYFILC
nr:MAG TPA: hypothetical protein [Caudoviricetes sp.]